jgi:hypothetical protein
MGPVRYCHPATGRLGSLWPTGTWRREGIRPATKDHGKADYMSVEYIELLKRDPGGRDRRAGYGGRTWINYS